MTDGLCQNCIALTSHDAEKKLLEELADEQAERGTAPFWQGMKKLLDVKFDIFEKKLESSLRKHIIDEVKELIVKENELLRVDVETLKEENKDYEERIKNMEKVIEELKLSIEMTDDTINKTMGNMQKVQKEQKTEIKKITDEQQEQLDEQEDRARRNNLRVGGIFEDKGENWQDCKKKVKEFFRNQLQIQEDITIQRAHRSAVSEKSGGKKTPRIIILQLLNFEDKERILQACKLLKCNNFSL